MKSIKTAYAQTLKKAVERSLTRDANSTSCIIVHQPKAPSALKSFSKIEK